MEQNYIMQRLSALGANNNTNNSSQEIEELKAENARLKQQLENMPQANFKSDIQLAFEKSAEFEQILNLFYMRLIREKFGVEFKTSPYMKEFQDIANRAFEQFEKNYKSKEVVKNAQTSKKNSSSSDSEIGKNA